MILKAYWWDPKRSFFREFAVRGPMWLSMLRAVPKLQNFGDSVNPLILEELTGRQVAWAPLGQEDVVCIGSTINSYIRDGGQGLILGTGVREPHAFDGDFPISRVLGVRGLYSARTIGVSEAAVVGDPGLLISEILKVNDRRKGPPVFVPHLRMYGSKRGHGLIRALAAGGYTIIAPNNDPLDVARVVAGASSVLATSLHALVFADSYGVPCARLEVPWLNEPLFKFADYRSAFGIELASISIDRALSGADVGDIAAEECQFVSDRLQAIIEGLYAAAEPLRS